MEVGIIGAGIGGLTTALLLSSRGFEVTVYEKEKELGGRLAYQRDESGRFAIDKGPTIVLLPDMLLDILEEGGMDTSLLPLMECDPLYAIHYADGTVFQKHRDQEKQLKELDRVFPGERSGYLKYMMDMEIAFNSGVSAFLSRPFFRKSQFYTWNNMKLLLQMKAYKSVRKLAADYFRDERLQDAFSLQTLYIGGAPFSAPALYTLIPYAEHAFGVWYLRGGYAGLVQTIREVLEQRGVTFVTGCKADHLLIEHGSCIGFVSDQQEYRHDSIIFNGDFPHLAGMIPQTKRNAGSVKLPSPKTLQKEYEPSSGCFLIYLGLNKRYEDVNIHQFFLPASLQNGLRQLFVDKQIPNEPSFYTFYPTALDDTAACEGESVMYILVPVPPAGHIAWDELKDEFAQRILDEAEQRGFPDLQESILWMDIRTPDDAEQEGMYRGGSFGIAPSLKQSAIFRPQIVPFPSIMNLYSVGASVHPGGGIPIVMQGARLLADHLTKERVACTQQTV
ncbi:phytoene desaturase family protein [Paenibacillus lemnae]|uniref:Phytoene desaturase n=1 Tax=Paenibacillus lemnae TaxID=1330551 RepID=A0A848MAF1_PAELE|nr:phytoene desaturase family protein [Paenibacillus lemnae]NMO97052.1 phytoene desaturase [Paenibacillus lemnae]